MVSKKDPRGTGADILKAMGHPLCGPILEYKKLAKLVSTYIDALPQMINKRTGRLHCNFNQYGAATGRFSSSNPNFQNLPSKNHDIRQMFSAARVSDVLMVDGKLEFLIEDLVPTINGDKNSQDLQIGDIIICDDGKYTVKNKNIEDVFVTVNIERLGD